MDIRNVGTGSVDRADERTKKAASVADVIIPSVRRDEASISPAGREAAATVERLAQRARGSDRDREPLVAAAQKKLLAGELDGAAAAAATARALLDAKFLSA